MLTDARQLELRHPTLCGGRFESLQTAHEGFESTTVFGMNGHGSRFPENRCFEWNPVQRIAGPAGSLGESMPRSVDGCDASEEASEAASEEVSAEAERLGSVGGLAGAAGGVEGGGANVSRFAMGLDIVAATGMAASRNSSKRLRHFVVLATDSLRLRSVRFKSLAA